MQVRLCAPRRAPRPDGPLTHFASPRGETCRLVPPPPRYAVRIIRARNIRIGVMAGGSGGCFRSVPNRGRPEPRRTALVVKPARNGARRADTGSGAICRPYRPMPPHNAQRSRDWAADARQVRGGAGRLVLTDVKAAGSVGCFRSVEGLTNISVPGMDTNRLRKARVRRNFPASGRSENELGLAECSDALRGRRPAPRHDRFSLTIASDPPSPGPARRTPPGPA